MSSPSMIALLAQRMIGQRLNDRAVAGSDTTGAGRRDPLQLLLQRAQSRNLVADVVEMGDGDRMGLVAGHAGVVRQLEQGADAVDGEAEISGVLDEGQALEMGAAIAALVALRALWLRKKPDLLVVADRLDLHAGPVRERSDRHDAREVFCVHIILPLEPEVARDRM
ncbi:hypothetical protein BOS5A_220039 [Bosea sp. EC-HK365B]|nr:hypothetical protein BOSE7B_40147 [Bosea sp. 7B]CAD5290369.1 hypothetical protein BOSE21B_60023 [Bosea sp. 21B]VVT60694.1 hypothetical protein BOS5A_220039 [Bosea sp. EC-HK365B]VXB53940.1 hypothetical protein BOSE127_130038 [Bosea sp. 127]